MNWWDIPVIALGLAIGSWAGGELSYWLKCKLGWISEDQRR